MTISSGSDALRCDGSNWYDRTGSVGFAETLEGVKHFFDCTLWNPSQGLLHHLFTSSKARQADILR